MKDVDLVGNLSDDRVRNMGSDYIFSGFIVSMFQKKSGAWRYVVENDDGILHIFSAKNLTLEKE